MNHSTTYRTEVKNEWSYVFPTSLHGVEGEILLLLLLNNPRDKWLIRSWWGLLYVRTTVQTGLNLTNSGI